jgi:hypothetical protein
MSQNWLFDFLRTTGQRVNIPDTYPLVHSFEKREPAHTGYDIGVAILRVSMHLRSFLRFLFKSEIMSWLFCCCWVLEKCKIMKRKCIPVGVQRPQEICEQLGYYPA